MAIAAMAKVMIVSHRTEASELLEAIQREGICQILNAEDAVVSKDFPELAGPAQKPRDIEDLLGRLKKCLVFLKDYAQIQSGLGAALAPRIVVEQAAYDDVVADERMLEVLEECERIELELEKLVTERENIEVTLADLEPWKSLESPVEELGELETTVCLAGLLPSQHYELAVEQVGELGGVIEHFGLTDSRYACLVFCLNEDTVQVQKLLRSVDFEQTGFDHLSGTVAKLIEEHSEKLAQTKEQVKAHRISLRSLADNYLNLQMLADHYSNLLSREQAKVTAPATEQAVILEGWLKKKDYSGLEQIVSAFPASSLSLVEVAEDEEVPVEIENKGAIRPFEVVTRLYGMPRYFELDPTLFLTPFFALFFALCLTDAGYALVIIVLMLFIIKKMQGDKKLIWMLTICSVVTLFIGALTGGWFGDLIQQFIPVLAPLREKLMWFDPLEKPMIFFAISLALGYFQIIFGLAIAFGKNIKDGKFTAAVFDQLTWLVMLNSIVLFFVSKAGLIPPSLGRLFGYLVLVPAGLILLFSERQGSIGGRLGMGFYNLFSTIFYLGDVLSYVRLMALGITTAGLAMAVNVLAKVVSDVPHVGFALALLVLIGGHLFNTAMSALSAFVHTLRLQYVEFFSKFFSGGGREFKPLQEKYQYIKIESK